VATEAGVSRPTVYAHFPTREALVEAVAERAVGRATAALEDAHLEEDSPLAALDRVIEVAWDHLDRGSAVARAAGHQLSSEAMARAHTALRGPIGALLRRGQAAGVFRTDLPEPWLISSYFALMHACGEEVRGGTLDASDAVAVLQPTLRAVFTG
jgi:AcrR family transcriptional regulator